MEKWNLQSEKDIESEPLCWTATFFDVILKDGTERVVACYLIDQEVGYHYFNYYPESVDNLDCDDILLWRKCRIETENDKWKDCKMILEIGGERHRMIYDRRKSVTCENCSMDRHCAERPDEVLRPCFNAYVYFVKEEPNNK